MRAGDKKVFDDAFGTTYGFLGNNGLPSSTPEIFQLDSSTRLTWAAIRYPHCIPLAAERSVLGFYDTPVRPCHYSGYAIVTVPS